jgi:hypothetical protein
MAQSVVLPVFYGFDSPGIDKKTPEAQHIEELRRSLINILAPMVSVRTQTITADATLQLASPCVLANATSGAIIVTLPLVNIAKDFAYFIKKIDSSVNTVTIVTPDTAKIDGADSRIITVQYAVIMLASDGSNWHLLIL